LSGSKEVRRAPPMSAVAGAAVIILFCLFTFSSWVLLPKAYSPASNWLSDLGNSSLNPNGAVLFNLGCILTGIALFPFFIGLYKWYTDQKWRKTSLMITQAVGFAAALALIMIGVFSEDAGWLHHFWSQVFFVLNFLVFVLVGASLFNHPHYIRAVAYYGFIIVLISLIFGLASDTPVLEWFTVFTSLGYVGLLSYNMIKKMKT
jgi:hypothetical membrane protein